MLWTVALERTLESRLACKEIQPLHPKGNQSWIFIGRTDTEAETPILWPPDVKNWFFGKDPDARKDWRQEKGTTEDEVVGWYYQLDGHRFGWTPGVGDEQGSLACCSLWGYKELDYKESWAPKNWCFEPWCWRGLFRVPWTARRSNHSILKEISPEYSPEGLMLLPRNSNTLATWCEELTHLKRPWRWERLKAGGEGDDRG